MTTRSPLPPRLNLPRDFQALSFGSTPALTPLKSIKNLLARPIPSRNDIPHFSLPQSQHHPLPPLQSNSWVVGIIALFALVQIATPEAEKPFDQKEFREELINAVKKGDTETLEKLFKVAKERGIWLSQYHLWHEALTISGSSSSWALKQQAANMASLKFLAKHHIEEVDTERHGVTPLQKAINSHIIPEAKFLLSITKLNKEDILFKLTGSCCPSALDKPYPVRTKKEQDRIDEKWSY